MCLPSADSYLCHRAVDGLATDLSTWPTTRAATSNSDAAMSSGDDRSEAAEWAMANSEHCGIILKVFWSSADALSSHCVPLTANAAIVREDGECC